MIGFSNFTRTNIDRKFFDKIQGDILKAEKSSGKISITLVSSEKIKKINKDFRKKNKPTDVISFSDRDLKKKFILPEKQKELGEIFLCPTELKKLARKFNSIFEIELARSFIHGILHLIGYNHKNKKGAELMIKKQEQYLQKFTNLLS